MSNLILIIVTTALVNNVVLSQFLGICSFLGVSSQKKASLSLGLAVTAVLTVSSAVASLLYDHVLLPLGLDYLKTIVFILVIAALVQMVEIVLKKVSPSLYQALGIFLPLITTNCTVLGVAITVVSKEFTFGQAAHLLGLGEALLYAFSTAVGYGLAMVLFAGMREQLALSNVPKAFRGIPIALITVSILAMAFMGFSGMC